MPPADRTAQGARDKEEIVGPASRPRDQASGLNPPNQGNGYRGARRARGFASNDADTKAARGFGESLVKRPPVFNGPIRRRHDVYQRVPRLAPHCGNVAQWTAKRLPSHFLGFVFGQIVNTFDHAICFQQKHFADSGSLDNRAIVAGPHERVSSKGKIFEKDLQQPVFAHILEFHFKESGHARVKMTVMPLKRACIRIEAPSDPAPS